MKEAVIGIDIGELHEIRSGGQRGCLVESFTSTTSHLDFDDYLKDLLGAIEKSMQFLTGRINIRGIGIGAPKGNYYKGTIEDAANLNWGGIIAVTEKIQKYYPGMTIVLTNDANAAAIGEMVFGGAKNMKDFIVITLGTGLGSGIVVGGSMVYGQDGFAGELGHVNVQRNGRDCACGQGLRSLCFRHWYPERYSGCWLNE
jgi:glucokinase